jgi:5-methylcytosine-specific restriction enzyme A
VTLKRSCLGCKRTITNGSRCRGCQAARDKAKHAKRPDKNTNQEIVRRRRAVAEWRATMGDWCPGVPELDRGAHPAADLTADHVLEVAAGGLESGALIVRCGSCNSARSANVRRLLPSLLATTPLPPKLATHTDQPPSVA